MALTDKQIADFEKALELFKGKVKDIDGCVEAIKSFKQQLGDVSIKDMLEIFEKQNIAFDKAVAYVKRGGMGIGVRAMIPGLEDGDADFSIIRAFGACTRAQGSEDKFKQLAPHEYEIMKHAREFVQSKTSQTNIDERGGFFVPDQVIAEIIVAVFAKSAFLTLPGGEGQTRVRVLDGLVGDPVTIPEFARGMQAFWIAERDEYQESTVTVGELTLRRKKLTVLAVITEEMLRWGAFGFEQLFRDDMATAIATEVDRTIMFGSGIGNEPRGLFARDDVQYFSHETGESVAASGPVTAAGGDPNFDALQNMMGLIEDENFEPNASFAYISSPRFWRRLKQLKIDNFSGQAANQPFIVGIPMLSDARLRELVGFDIGRSTQIPTTNKAGASKGWTSGGAGDDLKHGDVFAGNWDEFLFARWSGIDVLDDGGVGNFRRDETQIKMRMWADQAIRQPKAIVLSPDARVRV